MSRETTQQRSDGFLPVALELQGQIANAYGIDDKRFCTYLVRGLLALVVFSEHAYYTLNGTSDLYGGNSSVPLPSGSAVVFFFILSAQCLCTRKFDLVFARLSRLLGPVFGALLAQIFFFPEDADSFVMHTLTYLAGGKHVSNGPLWSLRVELQMGFVSMAYYRGCDKYADGTVSREALLAFVAFMTSVGVYGPDVKYHVLPFLLGTVVVRLREKSIKIQNKKLRLCAAVFGVFCAFVWNYVPLFTEHLYGVDKTVYAVGGFVLLYLFESSDYFNDKLELSGRTKSFFMYVGSRSFLFYVLHFPTLAFVHAKITKEPLPFVVTSCLLTALVAELEYRIFDKPFAKMFDLLA